MRFDSLVCVIAVTITAVTC